MGRVQNLPTKPKEPTVPTLLFRTFGAHQFLYEKHALTGVAINFRPFGPQARTHVLAKAGSRVS